MPKIGPLSPDQARGTLAHRLTRTADNLRQLATKFGIRPYRVFLVWTQWSGEERGEGDEKEVQRVEILPTPRITSLDSVTFSLFSAGVLPVGSVRVDRISGRAFSNDLLSGIILPDGTHADHIPEPFSFFYEVVEDGRGDNPALRSKFRLLSFPFRRAEQVDWTIMLERISEDRNRYGQSQAGVDFPGPGPGIPPGVTGP
jgi:hypothetical protein